jgi:hypothetical protein
MTVIPRSVARPLRGLSRLKHHAIRSRNRRRVPASRGVVDVTSAVRDEFPRQLSFKGLSPRPTPLPGRHRVRLRPQTSLRFSGSRFKLRQRTDVLSMLATPPGQARLDQLVTEHPAIGQHHIGHNPPVAVPVPRHDLHDLPERQLRGELLGTKTEVLARLGTIDTVKSNPYLGPVSPEDPHSGGKRDQSHHRGIRSQENTGHRETPRRAAQA